jgi:hypothetical protein
MPLGILGLVDTTFRLYTILVKSAEVVSVLKKDGWKHTLCEVMPRLDCGQSVAC